MCICEWEKEKDYFINDLWSATVYHNHIGFRVREKEDNNLLWHKVWVEEKIDTIILDSADNLTFEKVTNYQEWLIHFDE